MKKILEGMEFALGFFLVIVLAYSAHAFTAPSSGPSTDYYVDTSSPLIDNVTYLRGNIYTVHIQAVYSGTSGGGGSFPAESCPSGFTAEQNRTFITREARDKTVVFYEDWTVTLCKRD